MISDHPATITKYSPDHQDSLFALMEREGEEWMEYWGDRGKPQYIKALQNSNTWLVFENNNLCGFVRCKDDDGFGIYIHDLLVDRNHRGKEYGRLLMEEIYKEYPDQTVYVMSDIDPYYQKLKYQVAGTIFIVQKQ